MRENRRRYVKSSPAAGRAVALVLYSVLVLGLGSTAVIAISNSNGRICEEIARLEKEKRDLRIEKSRAEARWSYLSRPEELSRALVRHGLDMELADCEMIVSLDSSSPARGSIAKNTEIAAYAPPVSGRRR